MKRMNLVRGWATAMILAITVLICACAGAETAKDITNKCSFKAGSGKKTFYYVRDRSYKTYWKTDNGTKCNLNFYHLPKNAPVLIAQYDSVGRMTGISKETTSQEDGVTVDVQNNTSRVSAFAWKALWNISPLAAPAEVNVQ